MEAVAFFGRGVFFFGAGLCEGVFAEDFEVVAGLFAFVLVAACALAAVCDFLARTCATGARWTGCETSRERCGLIVLDERWFQRLRSSTETLNRSATVTSVSPTRVM